MKNIYAELSFTKKRGSDGVLITYHRSFAALRKHNIVALYTVQYFHIISGAEKKRVIQVEKYVFVQKRIRPRRFSFLCIKIISAYTRISIQIKQIHEKTAWRTLACIIRFHFGAETGRVFRRYRENCDSLRRLTVIKKRVVSSRINIYITSVLLS